MFCNAKLTICAEIPYKTHKFNNITVQNFLIFNLVLRKFTGRI
jgi:hypothetical protein